MNTVELEAEIRAEFPSFQLVPKRLSRFMRIVDALLRFITFGKMRTFMTHFTTTVGYTVYLPDRWGMMPERSKCVVLCHERVHMRQRRKYGLLFPFLYLFVLPTVWAHYRLKFEKEAYEEGLRVAYQLYGESALEFMRDGIIRNLSGANYFWACISRRHVEAWYDEVVKRIRG